MPVTYVPQQQNWADSLSGGTNQGMNTAAMFMQLKKLKQDMKTDELNRQRIAQIMRITDSEELRNAGLYKPALRTSEAQATTAEVTAKFTPTLMEKQIEQVDATVANQTQQAATMKQNADSQRLADARVALEFNRVSTLQDLTSLAPNMVQAAIGKDTDRLAKLDAASQSIINGSVSNFSTQFKAANPSATNEQVLAALAGHKGSLIAAKNNFTSSINQYMNLTEVSTRSGMTKPTKEVQKLTGVEETDSNITPDDLRIMGVAGQLIGSGSLNMNQLPDFMNYAKQSITGQQTGGKETTAPSLTDVKAKQGMEDVAKTFLGKKEGDVTNMFGGKGEQVRAYTFKKAFGTDIAQKVNTGKRDPFGFGEKPLTFDESFSLWEKKGIGDIEMWDKWSMFLQDKGFSFDSVKGVIVKGSKDNPSSNQPNSTIDAGKYLRSN